MDPLSITGVTIAALEQTWKIGKKTAELISDFRDFDQVSGQPPIVASPILLGRMLLVFFEDPFD